MSHAIANRELAGIAATLGRIEKHLAFIAKPTERQPPAVEAVLALHARRTDCIGTEENPVCHHCLEIFHILDDPTRRAVVVRNEAWPCRTVQALADALGASND